MADFSDLASLDDLFNLALAAVIGFLIGFEREWTHVSEKHEHAFPGARTFTLFSLIGGLTAILGDGHALLIAAFIAVAALTIVAYWADAREAPGIGGTTETAIFATFFLGAAATSGHTLIAVVGAVGVAGLLSIKDSIKRMASSLSEVEVHAALRLLAISIIVLPVLPNQGFGPYAALNPREIWLMVVFISGLSFVGYWLVKILGAHQGVFFTGVVGGLASSTATTLSLSRFAKDNTASPLTVAAGVVAANVAMLIRVGLVLGAVSKSVFTAMLPVLAVSGVVGAVAAVAYWRLSRNGAAPGPGIKLDNPMEMKPAIFFAIMLAVIALASRFSADLFGEGALVFVGLISGLADVDAMTLTAGRQAAEGAINPLTAGGAVMAAVASNIAIKGAMAASIGGRKVGMAVGGAFIGVIAAGALVYFVL